jgi:predicted metal-binding membrane protein
VVAGGLLLLVTLLAWAYVLHPLPMDGMSAPAGADMGMPAEPSRSVDRAADLGLFLFGWAVMMVAMMLPAALPLVLLYRAVAEKRQAARRLTGGMAVLLAGYFAVWTAAGLPVYGYNQLVSAVGPPLAMLPAALLIAGGVYQFTGFKHACHSRCSNPLFFLTQHWRPGLTGAARLGVLHGADCLGCCVGLMLALVALGMMNIAWMLTAAVIIFVEKTVQGGQRVARPLGVALVLAGVWVLGASLSGGGMEM